MILLSTMHDYDEVDMKTQIVLFYNSSQRGIDTVDQKRANTLLEEKNKEKFTKRYTKFFEPEP